jgi:hypothetical protein
MRIYFRSILLFIIHFKYSFSLNHLGRRRQVLGFRTARLEIEEQKKGGIWVEELEDKIDGCYEAYEDGSYGDDMNVDCRENFHVDPTISSSKRTKRKDHSKEIEEHPMRTDEWIISVSLSPLAIFRGHEKNFFPVDHIHKEDTIRKREQHFKFARNGYVILVEKGEENHLGVAQNGWRRVTKVGKWKLGTNGVSWTIPIKSTTFPYQQTNLHYHADIHLSKFQDKPRMFRGVVTRDRFSDAKIPFTNILLGKEMFRPVIATFVGLGTGHDTVDTTYKKRGIGLSSGNA